VLWQQNVQSVKQVEIESPTEPGAKSAMYEFISAVSVELTAGTMLTIIPFLVSWYHQRQKHIQENLNFDITIAGKRFKFDASGMTEEESNLFAKKLLQEVIEI